MTDILSAPVGIDQTTPLAPLHVGAQNVCNSAGTQVLVSKAWAGTANGHDFSSSSDYGATGGFCPYDARYTTSGSGNQDHNVGFQFAPTLNNTGVTQNVYPIYSSYSIVGGTVATAYAVGDFQNPGLASGGNISGTLYGLRIRSLTSGATNFAVVTEGTTPSVFGGSVSVGGQFSALAGLFTSESAATLVNGNAVMDATPDDGARVFGKGAVTDFAFENCNNNTVFIVKTGERRCYFSEPIFVASANANLPYDVTIGGENSNYGAVGYNYIPGSGSTYGGADTSSRVVFSQGGFKFQGAPSGAAGASISFTDLMDIDVNGYCKPTLTTHADNASAISGGVPSGCLYKTSTGEVRVVV